MPCVLMICMDTYCVGILLVLLLLSFSVGSFWEFLARLLPNYLPLGVVDETLRRIVTHVALRVLALLLDERFEFVGEVGHLFVFRQ